MDRIWIDMDSSGRLELGTKSLALGQFWGILPNFQDTCGSSQDGRIRCDAASNFCGVDVKHCKTVGKNRQESFESEFLILNDLDDF